MFTVDALQGRHFNGKVEAFSPATASEFSLLAGSNTTGNFTKIVQRLPVRISIDPSLLADDKDMLEDLIAAAFNDARDRADRVSEQQMKDMQSSMGLPPGFNLPGMG